MPAERPSRGVALPGIGPVLIIAAAVCGGWLLWTEFSRRGWIPGVGRAVDDPVRQIQAVEALVKRGRESVPELVAALGDDDPKIRRGALLGLGRIGPEAGEAMPLVRGALTDNDARVRGEAVTAFGRISRDPRLTAELLAPLLADSNENVRESAALILETIGAESIGPVVEIVHSDLPVERGQTLQVLRRVLGATSWTGRLDVARSLLSDSDRDIRLEAVHALFHNKVGGPAVLDAVRPLLDDPDQEVRLAAMTFIVGRGRGSNEQIRTLLTSGIDVETALGAIARRGPAAAEFLEDVVPVFQQLQHLEIASSRDGVSRTWELHPRFRAILAALSSLKIAARPAAADLLARMGELHAGNRILVVRTLVDIGTPADDVIPILSPLLIEGAFEQPIVVSNWRWDEREMMHQAGIVLRRASPDEGRRQTSLLIPRLTKADGKIDKKVLYALWGLGPAAADALPVLMSLIPNPDGEVFQHAVVTLGEIGPQAAPAVPALVAALEHASQHTDGGICGPIIEALGKIGPAAKSAVPLLLRIIDEPERFVLSDALSNVLAPMFRRMAISSVGEIDDGSPEVLTALRSQVASAPDDVRRAAIKALALIAERAARNAISPIERDSE
jgi:HEAT repeat protein